MTEFTEGPSSDDKLWAALSYVFAPLVPIFLLLMEDKKNRPYLKIHIYQGLILGILAIVTAGICLGFLVWLYSLYLAYLAYQGKPVVIPFVTDFCKNQGWA